MNVGSKKAISSGSIYKREGVRDDRVQDSKDKK